MPNPYGVPEISVEEVAKKRDSVEPFILLDVREPHELRRAALDDAINIPLSTIAQRRLDAFPNEIADNKDAEIIVFCHHGARSAQVAAFLRQAGWNKVLNMDGGIDAYATVVDSSIGRY